MGSSPTPPTPQDPGTTARTQYGYNTAAGEASQRGSMVNQQGTYGGYTYQQTGTAPDGTPLYTLTQNLSPQQQQLQDIRFGTQQVAGQQGQSLLTGANYGGQSPAQAIGNEESGMMGDVMGKEVSYLQPYFQQSTNQLDAQLRNQGFTPGTEGYNNAMMNLQKSQAASVTGFEAQVQPQVYSEAQQNYLLPLTMTQQLSNFAAPMMPQQFQTPGLQIAPPDYTNAVNQYNQAQQATYSDQVSQYNNMMSGLFGIGTGVLGGMAKAGQFAPLATAMMSI